MFIQVAINGHSCHPADDLTQDEAVIDQVIGCLFAGGIDRGRLRQFPGDHVPERPAQNLPAEVGCRDAGLVQEGMPDCGGLFTFLTEFRPVFSNGCVHLELALFDQLVNTDPCEGLGHREGEEGRLRGDRPAETAFTMCEVQNDLPLPRHHQLRCRVEFLAVNLVNEDLTDFLQAVSVQANLVGFCGGIKFKCAFWVHGIIRLIFQNCITDGLEVCQYNFAMASGEIRNAFKTLGQSFRLWWEDWSNGIVVSLATILATLTGLLAGPAILGMSVVAEDLADGVRTGIAGWWGGFKRYFWVGLFWGVVNIIVYGLAGIALWFYTQWDTPWSPLLAIFLIVMAVIWTYVQLLTPGYLIVQEDKKLGLAWKNSLLTLLASPGFCLVSCGISLVILILSLATILPLVGGAGPLLTLVSVLTVRDRLAFFRTQGEG